MDRQVQTAMLAYLFQHVIEETQSGMDVAGTVTIQIQRHENVRFLCCTAYFRFPFSGKKEFGNFIPIFRDKGTYLFQTFAGSSSTFGFRFQQCSIILQKNSPATQVLSQFHIRRTVTDNETSGKIVLRIIQILRQHSCTWLPGRCHIFRHTTVDEDFIKRNPFTFQRLHHQVMRRPESFFRERCRAQPILIGHHRKFEIQFATDEAQVTHHFGIKLQLFQRIQLVIYGRFNHQSPVTVYK